MSSSSEFVDLAGTFHADEALAVNFLRTLEEYKNADLVRTRDPKQLDECDIVVDVGGVYDDAKKRYDHHQRGFEETFGSEWKTKLSSAGLVYKHYGKQIIANHLGVSLNDQRIAILWPKLYEDFVEGLDGIDNGIAQFESTDPSAGVKQRYKSRTDLSARVGKLNPAWNEENNDTVLDAKFQIASALTGSEFFAGLDYAAKAWLPAREIVEAAFEKKEVDERVLVLEGSAPWKEHLYNIESERSLPEEKKILYVLYPESSSSPDSKWRIQAVPVSSESFNSRKALPEPWRGVRDEALSELTGIQGCIFVHASGFIGGAMSRDGAVQMVKKALAF